MNFLLKLYDLLKIYPWRYFGLTILCMFFVFTLLALINQRKVDKWIQKLKLTFSVGLSGALLVSSVVSVIFFTFFSYSWITQVSCFNPIENYIINLVLLLSVSLLFGIIGFLTHLAAATAYKLDNINPGDYFQSSAKTQIRAVEIAQRTSSVLNSLLVAMEGEITVKFLGYVEKSDPDKIRISLKQNSFVSRRGAAQLYQIVGLPIYHLYTPSIPAPHMPMPPLNHFLTDDDFIYLENKVLGMYPDLYFHFSNAIENRLLAPKEYEKIKKIIRTEIEHIEQAVIPGIDEFYNGKHVKIKVFLYAYLIQALNFNQNYVVPLSNIAKSNHIFFALFRLLMQGTFISLVIKNILKT